MNTLQRVFLALWIVGLSATAWTAPRYSGGAGGVGATGPQGPAGSGSSVGNSTTTKELGVSVLTISTQSVCGYGVGACWSSGKSTITILSVSVSAYSGSTVAWTRVDLGVSTGGARGLPLAPFRFPPFSISTGAANGVASFADEITTKVVINAHEWIGVLGSSIASSGIAPTGVKVRIKFWENDQYSP